jgi:chaperonin GroEL
MDTPIAGMILTTDAIISEKPEEEAAAPAMPGGMDY